MRQTDSAPHPTGRLAKAADSFLPRFPIAKSDDADRSGCRSLFPSQAAGHAHVRPLNV